MMTRLRYKRCFIYLFLLTVAVVISSFMYMSYKLSDHDTQQVLVRVGNGRYVLMDSNHKPQTNAAEKNKVRNEKLDSDVNGDENEFIRRMHHGIVIHTQPTSTTQATSTQSMPLHPEIDPKSLITVKPIATRTTTLPPVICNNRTKRALHDPVCMGVDAQQYFTMTPNYTCLTEGTDLFATSRTRTLVCTCKRGWYGAECSIPHVVYDSADYKREYALRVATPPRRLIYGMPFNNEFDLLQAKVMTFGDIVDLFIIVESNYTASGTPKDRSLLLRLQSGFLEDYHHKILYVQLDYFPDIGYANGWVIDALLRNHIGAAGLPNVLDLRNDDVFVMNDADELPVREALMFLKLHRGYTEPVGFQLKHNVYGFYWKGWDGVSNIFGACSIQMLRDVFNNKPYKLRNGPNLMTANATAFNLYRRAVGGRVSPWSFGSKQLPAGWHCSWCFDPQGIKYKLLSAHQGDFPRWGSIAAKTKLSYISTLILNGVWFDDELRLDRVERTAYMYAPDFILEHSDMYKHLVDPFYLRDTVNSTASQ